MRVLHVYNHHRGGGGAEIATHNTMRIQEAHGHVVQAFIRSSDDLPRNFSGRLKAGLSAFHNPDSLSEFRDELVAFQPNVVHVYDLFPLISPAILKLCAREGVPAVVHCVHYRHTCPIAIHFRQGRVCQSCADGREYWAVLKNCRQNLAESLAVAYFTAKLRDYDGYVSRFIAPSEFTRNWMIERGGIKPEKITTVIPAISLPEHAADPGKGAYVGFAGRFTPEKGIQTIYDASKLTSAPFRLCRSDKFLPVELPTMDVCITRTLDDLNAFYRGARVMVVPSLWFETFGVSAAEAMGHGIPIVASRIGALAELVEDGVDGLHFEPGNARDLADKVDRLWSDPELCRRLGRAARLKISRWNSEHFYKNLTHLYEEVCGTAPVEEQIAANQI